MLSDAEKRTSKRKPLKELYVVGTPRKIESFGKKNFKDTEEAHEYVEGAIE